jgi:hypothetical protein
LESVLVIVKKSLDNIVAKKGDSLVDNFS